MPFGESGLPHDPKATERLRGILGYDGPDAELETAKMRLQDELESLTGRFARAESSPQTPTDRAALMAEYLERY